jgi:histidinol-phosphate aminotransferase
MGLRDLMRPDLAALEPPPHSVDLAALERELGRPIIKLHANENAYGASPSVAQALAAVRPERYPDAASTELRAELGMYLNVDPARIVCSAGGDEMIDLLLRLFLRPGDDVIDCTPSFVMYQECTVFQQGRIVAVPRRRPDFAVDIEAVLREVSDRTKVIFLCSPNNPTGNPTPREDVVRLLETGRVVVLDEAYAEFAGYTLLSLAERYDNLIVLRTMSKWAGLAGLRLGYALASPEVISAMALIKSPYNVGIAAQVAGIASLRDRENLLENVRLIVAERERLRMKLKRLAWATVYPSEANFLYLTVAGISVPLLWEALLRRGILVRLFRAPDALRLSVGLPAESDELVRALGEAYAELVG